MSAGMKKSLLHCKSRPMAMMLGELGM